MRKSLALFAALLVGVVMTTSANATVLSGQLGILDLSANGGINPATGAAWQAGDGYRFIFASSVGTMAIDPTIGYYNNFVQNLANLAGLGSVSWKVMGSTATVDARDNTNTNEFGGDGTGESFWLLNGTSLVADNYADLYGFDTHSNTINVSETGGAPFDGGDFTSNWTGSNGAGQGSAGTELGSGGSVKTGLWAFTSGRHWIERFNIDGSGVKGLYGVSEVLTITPEPASLALLGLGGLMVAARRRR